MNDAEIIADLKDMPGTGIFEMYRLHIFSGYRHPPVKGKSAESVHEMQWSAPAQDRTHA